MNSQRKLLPLGFQPGHYDVIIGRGKKCYDHVGNKNFLMLVASKLDDYSNAKTKNDKSKILVSIVSEIEKKNHYGGFIKKDSRSGLWFRVGESLAREKISQSFRDALHSRYRSSTVSRKRARINKQTKKNNRKRKHTQAVTQNYSFCQQPEILSESERSLLDHESSSIESKLSHKRRHVEAFDDTPLNNSWLPGKISINFDFDLPFKMGSGYCIDLPVFSTGSEDCTDLMSTCSSLVFGEETDESESSSYDDSSLETEFLFKGKLLHSNRFHNHDNDILQLSSNTNKGRSFFDASDVYKDFCIATPCLKMSAAISA